MTHDVDDGLTLVKTTGQKVREGADAVAAGIRNEVAAVAHEIFEEIDSARQHEPATHKRGHRQPHHGRHGQHHSHHGHHQKKQPERSNLRSRPVELTASMAMAAAALFVGRLVRSRPGRRPER